LVALLFFFLYFIIHLVQVSNTVLRFLWVIYMPEGGPSVLVRTFMVAFLEMLRKWQWNFCKLFHTATCSCFGILKTAVRVENEHLGNMDQYRVTREMPLPYACNNIWGKDGDDEEDQHLKVKR